MLPTVVPKHCDLAVLGGGTPNVDIEPPLPCVEKPKLARKKRHLSSGSWDRTVIIWGATLWDVEEVCTGHAEWARPVAMAPDGSVFAVLWIWYGTTKEQIRRPVSMDAQCGGVLGLSPTPDGQHVAAKGNGTDRTWNALARALVTEKMYIPHGPFHIVAAGGGGIHVWDSVSGEEAHQLVCKVYRDCLTRQDDICRCDMQSGV
ncbi:hypothetical protein PAXRUDRAFT_37075 [Paxillus rubicundulus Ve08.2h10]|uniref:Uncharacterized protein n=1 Tax=Paxillus rubicundulus Ve08.2h10 TaxID=930991 RepID=A0A0D0CRP9_9AGAM|nr:hypothetical protein PAXRUDRAFT_37075 [Paxillus rubicundulus Ve08.2h10]